MSITPARVTQPVLPQHYSLLRPAPQTSAHLIFPSYFGVSFRSFPRMSPRGLPGEKAGNLHFFPLFSLSPSPAQVV